MRLHLDRPVTSTGPVQAPGESEGMTPQPVPLAAEDRIVAAALSPDGRFLAYSDSAGLHRLDMESGQTTLWLPGATELWEQFQPRIWSLANTLLVQRTWVTDNTTPGWTTTDDDSWHLLPLPPGTTAPFYGLDSGAAWSPDGTKLAVAGYDYAIASFVPGLTVIDLDAGATRRILTETIPFDIGAAEQIVAGVYQPAWSPDGAWIAFGLDVKPIGPLQFLRQLHLVRPDGSELTPLTANAAGQAGWPLWIDSYNLYYSLTGGEVDGLYHYDVAAQTHRRVLPGSDLCPLSLSPDGSWLVYGVGCGLYGPAARDALNLLALPTAEIHTIVTGRDGQPVQFVGWLPAQN